MDESGQDLKACLWNHENCLQTTKNVIDELLQTGEKTSMVPLKEPTTLFGLVGIPVSHIVQNYTDPMNLGINKCLIDITPSICHLNQSSLWCWKQSTGATSCSKKPLQHTGLKEKVTAVVPIKAWNHPAVWKAYNKSTCLGKLILSAQLRGTFTAMPKDQSALTAATLLRAIQMGPQPMSQASLMADL